jgi:TIR domain
MEISEETEAWLKSAGYQYYCFISYPKIHEEIGKFALGVKQAIEKELALAVDRPKVFLDDVDIPRGADWEGSLSQALCSSVAMVALCVSAYYRSHHRWCGVEWAAMENLGTGRLRGHLLRPIIPLMLRLEKPIPDAVLRTQYIEMTAASLTWEEYCTTLEFKKNIQLVVDYIGEVAEAIAGNQASAGGCGEFLFPSESAFVNWRAARQEFPLHAKK